jgi:hypothetical protein|nr:MAG TPA: hypothetical protein [Caudoviricetes sp.]
MEDTRIYDFEFKLLHIENNAVSLNWTLYYNDIGVYEGHFPQSPDLVKTVFGNDYLVVIQGDKQAIITGKQLENGECILYGKTVNWILSRRICRAFKTSEWTTDKDVESIARYVVSQGFEDEIKSGVFALGEKIGMVAPEDYYFWRQKPQQCIEIVKGCLDDGNAGHRVTYDITNRQWIFTVYKGCSIYLLVGQGQKNAYNVKYSKDIQNYYTSGIYEQQSETVEGETPPDEGQTVWNEIQGDADKQGIYRWQAVLNGNNPSESSSDLKSKKILETATATLYNLEYGKDYMLGDTVKLQLEFNGFRHTVSRRITGVTMWYEANNIGQEPIFKEE